MPLASVKLQDTVLTGDTRTAPTDTIPLRADTIPLTGDMRADADIIAFYKARQKLIRSPRTH